MARARHEDYLARERAAGSSIDENPSLVEWADLPESLKDSNRASAQSVAAGIAKLGGKLQSLTGPVSDLDLPQSALDDLARGEHDRWMADLTRQGWTWTDGPKDPVRKLHPLLVPWEDLDESEREKDRDSFRALPRMLARVGYAICLPGSEI
jgi:hypothetical protein